MSGLQSFLMGGGGGKLRSQVFTASGTFTPSSTLLANGGQCWVQALGGGGAGRGTNAGASSTQLGQGGHAGQWMESVVTVSAAVTVTIGAGGAGASGAAGAAGGDTTFGALLTAKGGAAGTGVGQASGDIPCGMGSMCLGDATYGGRGINGKGGGGQNAGPKGSISFSTDGGGTGPTATGAGGAAAANSGAGGGGAWTQNSSGAQSGGSGGSGWLRVVWFE